LQEGSPLIGAGDPAYSNALDINGVPRSAPEIGLYEY